MLSPNKARFLIISLSAMNGGLIVVVHSLLKIKKKYEGQRVYMADLINKAINDDFEFSEFDVIALRDLGIEVNIVRENNEE
jgi:hypothetical protein